MTFIITIIVLALLFDFINGFHDAANSIATVVSTKVLTPFQAVLWAALFNFAAFFIFKDHGVANTVQKTVEKEFITLPVIFSGLVAAIVWNLVTWWYGIPSSSSHTLIGGFAGAAVAHAGFGAIVAEPVIKTASFIVLAPLVGMIMAYIISIWFLNSFRKGIAPKLISFGVIALVIFLVYSMLDMRPNVSKVKVSDSKESTLGGGEKHNAMNVVVFDATVEKATEAWKAALSEMKVKSTDGLNAEQVVISSISDKPVDLYSEIKADKKGKPKLYTAIRLDGKWLKSSGTTKTDSNAVALLEKFSKKIAKDAPVKPVAALLDSKNFKWLLFGFILISIAIFTLWMSYLNNSRSNKWFKRLQLLSSAAFSIGHGGNDAQKVMGIITAALIAGGFIKSFDDMPNWVPLACYTAIGLGTLSGGWKIVKTMGTKITKVTPFEGVAAETAGAVTLFTTENLKIPVSTTHTITGSIIGVGLTKRISAVRWGVTVNIIWAWVLTIPVSGLMAAGVYYITSMFVK